MKTLLNSLAILVPAGPGKPARAAAHLVAAQVVKQFPVDLSPEALAFPEDE